MGPASVEEIMQYLGKTDDHVPLVLYGHLLIEERLRDILVQISREPEELRAARLSFSQVMALCLAIFGRQFKPAWDFVERLNEARNKIVHRLDPGDLDDLLVSVITKLRDDFGAAFDSNPVARFRLAVIYTCGYLDSLKGSTRLRQAYGGPIQ